MKIEIWTDVVCPWCYIGKRKFEKALKEFLHAGEVELVWKSYQLSPDAKTDPDKSIYQYLADEKHISIEQSERMHAHVTELAAKVGLNYQFEKVKVINTFNAHRFLHFAKEQGLQTEAQERLCHAYFTEGKNVDDFDVLVTLGKEVGLNTDGLTEILEGERYAEDVKSDVQEGFQLGLRGVPFFVFNRKFGVSGAQEPEVFLETLQKSFDDWRKSNP